ncbi:hypothetical protein MMC26_005448 [Xylographa opegraphella]|nr:hypothetical protein [Xylographa opegraphella]
MLSRGNSTTSGRLGRAKSVASAKTRGTALELKYTDPEVARQHALTAANIAFERASGVMRTSGDSYEPLLNREHPTKHVQHDKPLRRRQSVRFTGSTAVPIHQRPITRRNAPSYFDASLALQYTRPEQKPLGSPIYEPEHHLTALPPVESISSTPSSYRRLRKSKSMFTPRRGQPLTFTNATPSSNELQGNGSLKKEDQRLPPMIAHTGVIDLSSHKNTGNMNSSYRQSYDQDAAIQLARDQYLHQLEQQRLKERPSMISLRQRGAQKAFRRTVRTSSTNSYGNAIGSDPVPTSVKAKGLGDRARNISATWKNKLRNVFHRNEHNANVLPSQQVEAKRAHFGNYISASSGLECEGPLPPTPDRELLSRVQSRSPSTHKMPIQLERAGSPGSIRSVRSGSPSIGRSRITSWTNSTAGNSLTKQQILERKRLSIIQEHGGPHQPSSSAGLIGVAARKGYAVFRKPLRGAAGSIKVKGQLDSQRVYSALQKRLDEHNRVDVYQGSESQRYTVHTRTSPQASNEFMHSFSLDSQGQIGQTIKLLPQDSDDSLPEQDKISTVDAIDFGLAPSTRSFSHDVFRSSPASSIKRKPVEAVRSVSERELTYQQIAERNESRGQSRRRPLREVKSAFFPSAVHYQPRNPSPYRRAVRSSMTEERDTTSREMATTNESAITTVGRHMAIPIEGSITSSSIYSRSPNGTPKAFRTSLSLSRSDNSTPGTATIVQMASPSLLRRPSANIAAVTASSAKSTDEWNGWMSAEVKGLEGHSMAENYLLGMSRRRRATHRRENAQIDTDDVVVGNHRRKSSGPKQPLAVVQANAVSRPVLGREASDQTMEKVPLRYPTIERTISTETVDLSRPISEAAPISSTPSGRLSTSGIPGYAPSEVRSNVSGLRPITPLSPFTPRHGCHMDTSRILAENKNFNVLQHHDAQVKTHSQSPNTRNHRYSPERAERLRRMQSSHFTRSKENMRAHDHGLHTMGHLQENQAINDLTPMPSPSDVLVTKGAGFLEAITTEKQAAGSQKMVELFLSKRRTGRITEEGSCPRHPARSTTTVNLDFDARVPVPFSIFPSSYRSDVVDETTRTRVEGEVNTERVGREGHETRTTSFSASLPGRGRQEQEEVKIYDEDRNRRPRRSEDIRVYEERDRRFPEVELARDRYQAPLKQHTDINIDIERPHRETEIDVTEREYRRRNNSDAGIEYERRAPREHVHIEAETTVEQPKKRDMGYYDDAGHYHSFRRGLERAADRVLHPFDHHHHHHDREEIVIEHKSGRSEHSAPPPIRETVRESVQYSEAPRQQYPEVPRNMPNSITIPCHHIRVGDLLILQGRPCQVIRISTSSQTGQHRYLGVDLFTKQLHEESSFSSNPAPSVIVQNMYGPVFKQYRVLDIREDGRVVAMTESGDIKQGLPVIDQDGLLSRLSESFEHGRGSVRVLVINDGGRELAVDYKVIHGSRL